MNIKEQMQFLGFKEVSTKRQKNNGTQEWKLPIKDEYGNHIYVGSFKSGYVRRTRLYGCINHYQLNKCKPNVEYWKLPNGDYRQYTGKIRIVILDELERLRYLIDYCLKNYYIGYANKIANGKYVSKWRYNNLADAARLDYDCGHYDRIRDLENKLDTIQRVADHG